MTNDQGKAYVSENFEPHIAETLENLQIGAAVADYWRILVLLRNGGVYLDIDANLVWPLERTLSSKATELLLIDRNGCATNSFLASAPNNSFFAALENKVRSNIVENSVSDVFEMTGPAAMWPVLEKFDLEYRPYRTVSHQGQFTNPKLQYPDKGRGKWWEEQKNTAIVKDRY
ncbi:hypothetical protein GCM10007385_28370 [Tateyamaria omphalii]|nr:hypothetical protein GCM10007385_28370 [Tateyamaria omphalii]